MRATNGPRVEELVQTHLGGESLGSASNRPRIALL
jgi:hypothetical protein